MGLETAKDSPDIAYQTNASLSGDEQLKRSRNGPFPRNHTKRISSTIAGRIKALGTHSGSRQSAGDRASVNAISDEKTPLVDEKKV